MLVEVIKNPKIICSEVRAQMMPTTAVVDANPAVDLPKHHPLNVAKAIEKLDIEALHDSTRKGSRFLPSSRTSAARS